MYDLIEDLTEFIRQHPWFGLILLVVAVLGLVCIAWL